MRQLDRPSYDSLLRLRLGCPLRPAPPRASAPPFPRRGAPRGGGSPAPPAPHRAPGAIQAPWPRTNASLARCCSGDKASATSCVSEKARTARAGGLAIDLFQDFFGPVGGAQGGGCVAHQLVAARAMPMALVGADPDDISGADGLWRLSVEADKTAAGCHLQDLTLLMRVPERARTWRETHAVDRHLVDGGHHRIGPHDAAERRGPALRHRAGPALEYFHCIAPVLRSFAPTNRMPPDMSPMASTTRTCQRARSVQRRHAQSVQRRHAQFAHEV